MLEIAVAQNGDIVFSGRFDAAQSDKALQVLEQINRSCVLDCTDLDYISSAGLAVFLATFKRLDDAGQTLVLKHLNQHIRKVFQVSGLDRVFRIEE